MLLRNQLLFLCFCVLTFFNCFASDSMSEYKAKRELDFSFQSKPVLEKSGEGYYISFEVKSFCDTTIVIEEEGTGRILRHLISGVLGVNAPEPFQKNSKVQKIYFDGKNDKGEYLKDFGVSKVRVSLGLSPLFEKNLFDIPKRRHGSERQLFSPVEEGVIVYDGGNNNDFVKLFSHTGEYLRTIYPFPADKIKDIKGLKWGDAPDGSGKFPIKTNFLQTSFLETGSNFGRNSRLASNAGTAHYGMYGKAASFISANKNNIVLGMGYMARIGTDGGSSGAELMGPEVGYKIKDSKGNDLLIQPFSAAISPDSKKVYFTGYHVCRYGAASNNLVTNTGWKTYHQVYEMDLTSNEPPKIFLGDPEKSGNDNNNFNMPINVFVDDSNRIYVCDYLNKRLQVFDQNKKLLKSIAIDYPAYVTVLPKSKEVVVISYLITNNEFQLGKVPVKFLPVYYYNLGTFENMKVGAPVSLPKEYEVNLAPYVYSGTGFELGMCVTEFGGETRLWMSREKVGDFSAKGGDKRQQNIKIWKLNQQKFDLERSFEDEVEKVVANVKIAPYSRQRMQVNPATGDLYMTAPFTGFTGKSFKELYKIKQETGKITMVDLSFDAEDYCFDANGMLYLKTQDIIGRYNIDLMKEVPWDYGIETKASTSASSDRKVGELLSGLKVPTYAGWHQGGIFVGLNGNIAISGPYEPEGEAEKKFKPEFYPGRPAMGKMNNLIHIFDRYGKLVKIDAVPGLKDNYGIGLDQQNNIYMMNGLTRVNEGKLYPNIWTGTVMKFPMTGAKLKYKGDNLTPIPLSLAEEPKRPFDLVSMWAENAAWYFGGVGFMGKNSGNGCACWNSRMAFDYLNRSFAPELERYSVAVLDSNGNLITRIGKYGNHDSSGAKSLKPVGGDEVTMVHGAYLATMSDKFLYIADIANDRIVEVKLNYASNEYLSFPK
jgi:hypothetical protein